MNFYVYVYLDPNIPGNFEYLGNRFPFQPFYVGKGCFNRLYDHLKRKGRNFRKNTILKRLHESELEPVIVKVQDNLSELDAFAFEMLLIKAIGRLVDDSGPLTNLTAGGEGHHGLKQSQETKDKRRVSRDKSTFWTTVKSDDFSRRMSEQAKRTHAKPEVKKKLSESKMGAKNPMFGKTTSDKQKEAVRKARAEGRVVLTEEGRQRLIAKNKRRKGSKNTNVRKDIVMYLLRSPDDKEFVIYGAVRLKDFCKENKIQLVTLKSNPGLKIGKEHITGKKLFARNTINWTLIIPNET